VVHTIQRPYGNRAPTEGVIARTPGLRQMTYGLCDRFVALGEAYAEDHVENFRIPARKIALNYIGIDLSEYKPDPSVRGDVRGEFGIAADAPLLGVIARHNPEKAVGRGIRMFSHLLQMLPDARLLLVGDGPTRPRHEQEVDELGVRHAVLFAGARPDSARIMNGCDAIMQTTYNPLNGISSIEAMATGKPVLTVVEQPSEERVARDTCVDGVNGLFLRLTTPEVTAQRLAALLRDPARLAEMGRASRGMAEQRFEITAHLRRLEALYDSLRRPS
jgi:glycosyltransferase involved in cell wall biosynthesis